MVMDDNKIEDDDVKERAEILKTGFVVLSLAVDSVLLWVCVRYRGESFPRPLLSLEFPTSWIARKETMIHETRFTVLLLPASDPL